MKKVILYIATSLNGKIARLDGSVDWLEAIPNPTKIDYGYTDFYDSIDTTIQGYSTYNQIIEWGIDFPYPDKKNYVFTRKQGLQNTEHITFISENHNQFVAQLKQQTGKDIWLIGGGQINTLLLNLQLIDEIHCFVMPIIIPDGIELFGALPQETTLQLIDSEKYATSAVAVKYQVNYPKNSTS